MAAQTLCVWILSAPEPSEMAEAMMREWHSDIAEFDSLPDRIRRALREANRNHSPSTAAYMLERGKTEQEVIDAISRADQAD